MNATMKGDDGRGALHAARAVAVVAGIFSLVVCIVIIANFLQTRAADPLNSKELEALIGELRERRDDGELREAVRALDLLARKAYFTSRGFNRAGAYLLVGGITVMLVSLKAAATLRRKLPDPKRLAPLEEPTERKELARRAVTALGGVLVVVSLGIVWTAGRNEWDALDGGIEAQPAAEGPGEAVSAAAYPTREEMLGNWPFFRGGEANGVGHTANAPVSWNVETGEGVLWKTAVPMGGFGSPVAWKDRVFLTGADEKVREVYCFDAETGELLWRRRIEGIPGSPETAPAVTPDTGHAAPTMAVDGRHAFAIFSTGDVACLDFDGEVVWARNLGVPENHYGHSSSLVTHEGLLLVQLDHGGGGNVFGLDAATGETVWRTAREVEISWSSPALVAVGGRTELLVNANPYVASYDPETGDELWSVDCMDMEVGPSPAYSDGMAFFANAYAIMVGINIETQEIVWEAYDDLPDVSSPLAVGGLLFTATSTGTVTCYEGATGAVHWKQEFDEGFYASAIVVGENVYLADKSGVMHIFKAAGEFTAVAELPLGEKSVCSPAFLRGRIFIRGEKNLYCMGTGDE